MGTRLGRTSRGPAAVPASVVRAVRDAGSARGGHSFAFWFWVVGDLEITSIAHSIAKITSHSLISQSVSHVSQSRAEPVSEGDLGAARDAGMRDGSVRTA